MLATLSSIKSRLSLLDTDTQYDLLLTNTIKAISARFDHETNRTLGRTENATFEFDPADTEICVPCYPIETVTKFESKTSEATGWQEITPIPDFLIRSTCIITLPFPPRSTLYASDALTRLVYAGGYVLPGTTPAPGQTPLPDDLEQAAVEQVAYWFQKRDLLAVKTMWPKDGVYKQFADLDLLDPVIATLNRYTRWSL
jgi:hypothetical protein